ncbi:hypothetical protein [Streptomyces jumonjinensis]|uniref:hypothetical protein n=1 Tax=Streptomyces jumonjinensis TaxID=1945 RepID=UPI0037B47771
MSPLALLPSRLPAAPPGLGQAPRHPAPSFAALAPPAAPGMPGEVDPAAQLALAAAARILDPDRRLSCTRWGIAQQRRELARHVGRLLRIAERGPFAEQAREVSGRAELLLAQCLFRRGLTGVIAVVRCAEAVRELAVLTHPDPDALRAVCRPAVAGGVR